MLHLQQRGCPLQLHHNSLQQPAAVARLQLRRGRRSRHTTVSAAPGVSDAGDGGASSSSSGPGPSVAVTSAVDNSSSSSSMQDAILARINAAKAYSKAPAASPDSGAGAAAPAAPPITSTSSSSSAGEGALPDEQQQAALQQQYVEQLRQQQAALAAQGSEYSTYLQQQEQQAATSTSTSSSSSSNALDLLQQQDPGLGGGQERGSPARPDFYTSPDAPALDQLLASAPGRPGLGSADRAADWLQGVLAAPPEGAAPAVDPSLRPEEFTAAKEAAAKQRGAEIITAFPEDFVDQTAAGSGSAGSGGTGGVDGAAAAGSSGSAGAAGYKPSVTTWGVFPRPSNISQAYGGGRNIRPGQPLETDEQRAKREAEYAAALRAYKAAVSLDTISDEDLRAAQATYNDAMRLFKRGALDDALRLFDEVRSKVPLKSRLGGLSTLQAAVCYDTLGNAKQAEALYKRIQGHPTSEVSKKARQLVFGFQAMSFLKTENLSYAVKKEDYLQYFRRSADRTRVYVASPEELAADRVQAARAAALAAGVVLGPVLVMGMLLAGGR